MSKRVSKATACLSLAGGLMAASIAMPALAQGGADYFKGKTVTYIVATAPGGGYDLYGRLVAEYMQRYLPGSTFVVRNLPGAGHLVGTNYDLRIARRRADHRHLQHRPHLQPARGAARHQVRSHQDVVDRQGHHRAARDRRSRSNRRSRPSPRCRPTRSRSISRPRASAARTMSRARCWHRRSSCRPRSSPATTATTISSRCAAARSSAPSARGPRSSSS